MGPYCNSAQYMSSTVTVLNCLGMEKATNITVKVDAALARDAKIFAARRGTSLSRLVSDQLELLVNSDQAYTTAKQRALRRLKRGYDLGCNTTGNRTDIHDRENLR